MDIEKTIAEGLKKPYLCLTNEGLFVLYNIPNIVTGIVNWHYQEYAGGGICLFKGNIITSSKLFKSTKEEEGKNEIHLS